MLFSELAEVLIIVSIIKFIIMAIILDVLELLSYPLVTSQYPEEDPLEKYFDCASERKSQSGLKLLYRLIAMAIMTPTLFGVLSNYE